MRISDIEIGTIVINFLNEGGLSWTLVQLILTLFTYKSIGIPLCETYRRSKGKISDSVYQRSKIRR